MNKKDIKYYLLKLFNLFFFLFSFLICCNKTDKIRTIVLKPISRIGDKKDKGTDDHYLFYRSKGFLFDNKGNMYLLDSGNNRILVFNHNGKFIRQVSSAGQGPGEILNPTDFELIGDSLLVVADYGNNRIQLIDIYGNYKGGFKLNFNLLNLEIAIDSKNQIYINNSLSDHIITVFSLQGKSIGNIGEVIKYSNYQQQILFNMVHFFIEADTLIMCFINIPIIRKYRLPGDLLEEKKLSLPEIAMVNEIYMSRIKKDPERARSLMPNFFHSMNFGQDGFIYLSVQGENHPLFRFDRSFKPLLIIIFREKDDSKYEYLFTRYFIRNDFIFAFDEINYAIRKFINPK